MNYKYKCRDCGARFDAFECCTNCGSSNTTPNVPKARYGMITPEPNVGRKMKIAKAMILITVLTIALTAALHAV